IGTAYNITTEILSIASGGSNALLIVSLVFDILFFPIFLFGIFVCCCARTSRLLKIYSILYSIFTVLEIIGIIVAIILFLVNKNSYVNDCANRNQSSGSSSNDCDHEYKIHFALVIAAYAAHRRTKENNAASEHEVSESNVSSTHETSSHRVNEKNGKI
ncbi:15245_t:CDS:2, partial [Gigaspora rosea]